MQFLIIVPFNLPARQVKITEEWLDYRYNLFKETCLLSLKNQTSQDFELLFLCYIDTPSHILKDLESSLPKNARFIFVRPEQINLGSKNSGLFCYPENKARNLFKKFVSKSWVASLHMGSDDYLSYDFIERIHNEAKNLKEFLVFSHGFLKTPGNRIYLTKNTRTVFPVLIEPKETFTSVCAVTHSDISKLAPVRELCCKNSPMWCYNLHNKNTDPEVPKRVLRMFPDKTEVPFSQFSKRICKL